jgi:HK97 family phage major capsid protein
MLSIQALREQRGAKAKSLHELVGKPVWDAAIDQPIYDATLAEIDSLDASIGRINEANKRIAEQAVTEGVIIAGERLAQDGRSEGARIFSKWLKGGNDALSAEDRMIIRNTMSTTTTTEGGFTVQKDVAKTVADALKAYGGMRASGATIINTEQGNPFDFPNSDGTSEVGEQLAENASSTNADPVFGATTLATYKFSSKDVPVPIELLMDSAIDIEAFITARLVARLGRITNLRFTTGTGSNQPQGIVTAATAGKTGTTGQTLTVIYDDLVDLQHSVDPAYRNDHSLQSGGISQYNSPAGFMMNDLTLRAIRKLKDGQSRPIFVPGYELGVPGGMPDTLLGSPIFINQDMPVMAANAKSILFGNFGPYIIRDVLDMVMYRMTDSAYAKKGQVGFLMLMRCGGAFTDVGGAVKAYVNSAT